MLCAQQPRLLVHVRDGAEVPSEDLKVGIVPHVVLRHLEHSEMKIRDWAKGTTSYEDYWCLLRIP